MTLIIVLYSYLHSNSDKNNVITPFQCRKDHVNVDTESAEASVLSQSIPDLKILFVIGI